MKWSTVMPVTALTVSIVQPGFRPSWPRLVLKRTFSEGSMTFSVPSSCFDLHSGMSTIRSRGMLIAVAFVRSLETCSRMFVSACPTLFLSPYPSLPDPVRLSVPMMRMLKASSLLKPSLAEPPTSSVWTLPSRCLR